MSSPRIFRISSLLILHVFAAVMSSYDAVLSASDGPTTRRDPHDEALVSSAAIGRPTTQPLPLDEYNLEDDGDVDDLTSTMLRKARELFEVCDVEAKGFITKLDMQRLKEELPLTADQLEDVFDSLDCQRNGYLTLYEFTDGFGEFSVSFPPNFE